MRKFAFAAAITGVLALCGGAAQAGLLEDIKARGKVTCGVLGNLEPFGFQDPKTREIVGYEIDLCRALAQKLNVTPELKVLSSQARIPELVQGRVDLLVALITYSAERAAQIDFSNAYVEDSFKFIVLKDSGIKKIDELATKRISVLKGSILEPAVQKRFPEAKILSLEDAPAAFLALQQGKVSATCQRTTQARALQIRAGDSGPATEMLDEPLFTQKSGFAVRKGNPEFVAFLNAFLNEYEASGEAEKLFDKWIGEDSVFKLEREFKVGDTMTE